MIMTIRSLEQMITEDLEEVLIPEEKLKIRVKELACDISRDYEGKDLLLVAVLKGALVFLADLARDLTIPADIDFIVVTSYASTRSTGEVRLAQDLTVSIKGRDILLVEDVVDNGLTIQFLTKTLLLREPASLRICALLDKPEGRSIDVRPDYCGFVIPNKFVVGYGLDYNQEYRNLPFIGVLSKHVIHNKDMQ